MVEHSDIIAALKWVEAGATKGWFSMRNSKGRLVSPVGYITCWERGLVHHSISGQLRLTDAGAKLLDMDDGLRGED